MNEKKREETRPLHFVSYHKNIVPTHTYPTDSK